MTQCGKILDLFASALGGELPGGQREEFARHLEQCTSCRQEFRAYQALYSDLKGLHLPNIEPGFFARQAQSIRNAIGVASEDEAALFREIQALELPQASDDFFTRQRQAILSQIEAQAGQPHADLSGQLARLGVPQKTEAFFEAQRRAILQELESSHLAIGAESIIQGLQGIKVAQPGELFFRRQAKQIRDQLISEQIPQERVAWFKPLAVAAALFFLVLGIARVDRESTVVAPQQWSAALEYMAEEETEPVGLETIDELNPEQLERLANNLEGKILQDAGDPWVDEPVEIDDLNEQELELLIRRLENRVET